MAEWLTLDAAAALIPHQAQVALGGSHHMAPLGLIKALIRRKVKGLYLITAPTGGFGVELLAAAGAIKKIETAQVSLGELGLAPAFRRAAESGRLEVLDSS